MLNQVIICGRITHDPETKELENDRKVTYITVAVPRSYKNLDGIYETDFITCYLYNELANSTTEYCKKGDIVGVKGRLQTTRIDDKNVLEVIAERVTFLSSKKSDEEE